MVKIIDLTVQRFLDNLLADGAITQVQYDALIAVSGYEQ